MTIEAYPSTEDLAPPRPGLEHLIQQQLRRVRFIQRCVGSVGLTNTMKAVYDRRFTDQNYLRTIDIQNRHLKHKLRLATVGSDLHSLVEVLSQGVYRLPVEPNREVNGKPIVDIGANIGITSAYFATRYPDSPILAVEPLSRNFGLLDHNSQPYGDQIEPINAALATVDGITGAIKHEPYRHNYLSYSFANNYAYLANGSPAAEAITPDGILDRLGGLGRIGLLKVDIDGAEKFVFGPEIDPLLEHTDRLLVETHDQYEPGSSQAVQSAAERAQMTRLDATNNHTTIYTRT